MTVKFPGCIFWGKWIVFFCTPNKLDCETSQPQNGGLVQISFSIGWCLASKCEFSGVEWCIFSKTVSPSPLQTCFCPSLFTQRFGTPCFHMFSKAFPQFPILSSHVKTSPHLPLLDDVRALQESDVRKPSPERKAHGRLVTEWPFLFSGNSFT